MSLSWLSRLVRPQSPRSSPARRRWPRPWLEALEDRWLLATVTTLLDNVPGSLREAIALTPAGGTVDFEPGLTGTITLTTGQLTIDKDLTIAGPGAGVVAVSGNNASRVFEIAPAVTVAISGLTITNGSSVEGGGIRNEGTLTLTGCALTGNAARTLSFVARGGGIWNTGTLTIISSVLSENRAVGTAAPFLSASGEGGGIWSSGGTLTLIGSTLSGNSAAGSGPTSSSSGSGIGGGIFGGTVIASGCTFSGNSAGGTVASGGGIASGVLTLVGCTLHGNSTIGFAVGQGGGISSGGTLTLVGSTLSGNTVAGGLSGPRSGGGIYFSGGTLTLVGSTLSGNRAAGSGTSGSGSGGGIFIALGGVTLRNTIIAGNTASSASPDVSGPVDSQGHNLIGIGDGGSGFHPTDLVGTAAVPLDPLLGPLADNGGPTLTHLPLPGSPVINAGDNADAPATDQRGFPRVVGGVIDIGAVELQATSIVPSVVINEGAAQRSLVTSLTVTFTGLDSPAPDAFEVRRQDGSVVDVTVVTTLVGGQAVAVLTFAGPDVVNGSLADGSYLLTVRGAGEAGGDFVFGDDPTEAFFRRYGDVDGDGLVTAEILFQTNQPFPIEYGGDFGALLDALGSRRGGPDYVDFLDANGDGVIDTGDLAQYRLDEVRSTIL